MDVIDIYFLFFFLGFTLGDPQRLMHPTDSYGRTCGVDEAVKDKPYLFYFDLTRCADPSVLVKGCPTPQVLFIIPFNQPNVKLFD